MKITFTKMVQDTQNGTGEMSALVGGEVFGFIEKICDAKDVGSLQCVWKYTVDSYKASYETDASDFEEKVFTVEEYGNPRTALAAAKKWICENLTTEVVAAAFIRWMKRPTVEAKWDFYMVLEEALEDGKISYSQAARITRKHDTKWGTGIKIGVLKMRVRDLSKMGK